MLTFENRNDLSHSSVTGGASLLYGLNQKGASSLQKQWVSPPLHLSKAHQDEGFVISQLLSPTAGLLHGDTLEIKVRVLAHTKAAVISPAACRIHAMDTDYATIRQSYLVENGGFLDVWTAPLILQSESKLKQDTMLQVAEGGSMLFCELVSPGRSAFGERFKFDLWKSKTRLIKDGVTISYENFICEPQKGDAQDWQEAYPDANYASMYLVKEGEFDSLIRELHDLETPDAIMGVSDLNTQGLGIKILAKDGVSLRKTVLTVRERLYKELDISIPASLNRSQSFFFS